jgi:hypothetical protein
VQKKKITEHFIYARLAQSVKDSNNCEILRRISNDERRHHDIWKQHTGKTVNPNKFQIWFYYVVSKLFGITFGIKLMERGEEEAQVIYDRQPDRGEATKLLENIIFNLKAADDGEFIRWGNMLKHWRAPILNHFDNHTTNGFTEGCNIKIKMLKRISYGLRNVEVYWRKMLLGFVPSRNCFHAI